MPAKKKFDASSSVAGTTGWSMGPIWPRQGSTTLILERRHLVGGAAITEELHPGFSFTTFSYALSLLRPEIIHELELTKHGFMPLLMPSTFAPMEDGDYMLARAGQEREPPRDRPSLASRRRCLRRLRAHDGAGGPCHQAADGLDPARHHLEGPRGAGADGGHRLLSRRSSRRGSSTT